MSHQLTSCGFVARPFRPDRHREQPDGREPGRQRQRRAARPNRDHEEGDRQHQFGDPGAPGTATRIRREVTTQHYRSDPYGCLNSGHGKESEA